MFTRKATGRTVYNAYRRCIGWLPCRRSVGRQVRVSRPHCDREGTAVPEAVCCWSPLGFQTRPLPLTQRLLTCSDRWIRPRRSCARNAKPGDSVRCRRKPQTVPLRIVCSWAQFAAASSSSGAETEQNVGRRRRGVERSSASGRPIPTCNAQLLAWRPSVRQTRRWD